MCGVTYENDSLKCKIGLYVNNNMFGGKNGLHLWPMYIAPFLLAYAPMQHYIFSQFTFPVI